MIYNPFEQWQNIVVEYLDWGNDEHVEVGKYGLIEIVPYGQQGDMAWLLWFECRYDDDEIYRHNGAFVESIRIKKGEKK